MFEPLDFSNMNEADIREEVLAPLIRFLGYRSGTKNNVIREQSLTYPRVFMGRKKPQSDPLVRGRADYILETENKIRWVIEAKPPSEKINHDVIEQAFTYANHPEVRAVYFMISNCIQTVIYQTNFSPDKKPLLEISYNQLNSKLESLKNILNPSSISKDFPDIKPDTRPPLANGLRSIARITSGIIQYKNNNLNFQALNEMQTTIIDGALERNEQNQMIAYLNTLAPTQSIQELSERLKLSSFEMISEDSKLSEDKNFPTLFEYNETAILPAGEKILNILTWEHVILEKNISCKITAKAQGIFINGCFEGTFQTLMYYQEFNMEIQMDGIFKIHLS